MPTMWVNGRQIDLAKDRVEEVKRILCENQGNTNAFFQMTVTDGDGDEVWVMIPSGAPVVITDW